MINENKYCLECKGYGNIYCQFTTKYGDKSIKEKSLYHLHECESCKGTGMILINSDKVTLFKIDELEKVDEEEEENEVENTEILDTKKIQLKTDIPLLSNDELEFEPKYKGPQEELPDNFLS